MSERSRLQMVAVGVLTVLASTFLLTGTAAAQQDDEVVGDVEISFDVGNVDAETGDFSIEVVEVSGELEDGQQFTVELTGAGAEVLWSATQAYAAPVTRIPVTEPISVGEVTGAGVAQETAAVQGVQIDPPEVEWSASGGGGSGQLALSMVMAVVIVAIIFRSPLPSASTERWTK